MVAQQNKDKERLDKELMAIFLLMLSYKNKINPLLVLFKRYRDSIKSEVGKIYLKYTKGNTFKMTAKEVKIEMKRLEPLLEKVANDLVSEENKILSSLMYMVYHNAYYKTVYALVNNIGIESKVKELTDKTINKAINKKINGKSAEDRNRDNKKVFINKAKRVIEDSLKQGKSIEDIGKKIDVVFNGGASVSDRLLENEIDRNANAAIMQGYRDMEIGRVRYNSTLEKNTCSVCASLDGTVFDIDDAPELPLHVLCGCYYTPVVD